MTHIHTSCLALVRNLICCTLLLVITGCQAANPSFSTDPPGTQQNTQLPKPGAIQALASSPAQARADQLAWSHLNEAEHAMASQQHAAAKAALDAINPSTLEVTRYPHALLWARWYIAYHEPWNAVRVLKQIGPPANPQDPNIAPYWENLASAHAANHQNLSAIQNRLTLSNWLEPDQRPKNNERLWLAALRMSPTQRQAALEDQPSDDLAAWLSLANLVQRAANNDATWLGELLQWRRKHPDHPAMTMLNHAELYGQHLRQAKHIALLLPQSGPLASAGHAITEGFMASYYQHHNQAKLTIIDTAEGNILDHYHHALNQGADHIVGPLSKSHVAKLLAHHPDAVPTLMLNTTDQSDASPNGFVLQFALSPIDEAKQIARHAWQQGHRRVLVVAPNNPWGQHIEQAFLKHWEALGGVSLGTLSFDPKRMTQIGETIQEALGTDASASRIALLKNSLHTHCQARPGVRPDLDWVAMLTTAKQAHRLYPMMQFYYLGNTPTYALSQSDPGHALTPNYYHDLSRVQLPTTAWVSEPKRLPKALRDLRSQLKAQNQSLFAKHAQLYALGADCERLLALWAPLKCFKHFRIEGASGQLHLDHHAQIHRVLHWGRFTHNQVRIEHT